MAEQSNLNSKKTKKEEKPAFQISENVDAKLDVIKKNIDFCEEAGTPEALQEGGKYFNAFMKLIESTVQIELDELKESLVSMLPFTRKASDKLKCLISKISDESKTQLITLTKNLDVDGIKKEIANCTKKYADKYIEVQLESMKI